MSRPRPRPKPATIARALDALSTAFGPQQWWPADSPSEVIVGAVLTQNTAWRNVRRAIDNLKAAGPLTFRALLDRDPERLAEQLRPSGYYNLKTRRLRAVCQYFIDRCGGRLAALGQTPTEALRAELLEVYGVGRETADSILLYALARPVFVVDAYTLRIGARQGWFAEGTDYETARAFFEASLPREVALFNEAHALLVRLGARCCRPTRPLCDQCPLGGR